jgi:hypothetical protein
MDSLERYVSLANENSETAFVGQVPSHFLVKRPSKLASSAPAQEIHFQTAFARHDVDPYASEWLVMPVAKRAGNPYPDRISIGRATNCDIVLRVHFVSKVQAHILRQPDGSYQIRDNRGVNMTRINGRPLPPDNPRPLDLGDMIAFGPMEFEFIDAARLYATLRSMVR